MMEREIVKYCLDSLKAAKIDDGQVTLTKKRKYELNVEGGEIDLLRTNFETDLNLIAIKDNKKGSITLNRTDKKTLDEAITSVIELSQTAQVDECNDISPPQEPKEFATGDKEPDLDRMYSLLSEFLVKAKNLFPKVILSVIILEFNHTSTYTANTNGVDFKVEKGVYKFDCGFSAKDGEKTSSFYGTACSMKALEKDLLDYGTVKELLKQSEEQLETKVLEGKFTGDILITPDCLKDFVEFYINTYLSDGPMISGTSLLKNKLDQQVASSKMTLRSMPVLEEIGNGYFITQDGFEAENVTIIEKGVLKSFLLSQYGAAKTNLERNKNSGGCYIVETGDQSFEEIVKSIDQGLLVARFSGGTPSDNGDFSGTAKNSYYIEGGEIKYPVMETMIAGNLYELFNNILAISKESIDFGDGILPWIAASGVTISGNN